MMSLNALKGFANPCIMVKVGLAIYLWMLAYPLLSGVMEMSTVQTKVMS